MSVTFTSRGQNQYTDSLLSLLKTQPADTNRLKLMLNVADRYYFNKPDSCLVLSEQAMQLARELRFTKGEIWSLNQAGEALRFLGNYPGALKYQMEALALNRELNDIPGEVRSLGFLGFAYVDFREYHTGIHYLQLALTLSRKTANQMMEVFDLSNIGNAYQLLGKPDSALYYQRQAFYKYNGLRHGPLKSLILARYAEVFARKEMSDSALFYFHKALKNSRQVGDQLNPPMIYRQLATLYDAASVYDSSLYYARLAIAAARKIKRNSEILEASSLLVKLFRRMDRLDSAFQYEDLARAMNDSLYGPQKIRELQLLVFQEQQQQQLRASEQEQFVDRIKYISLLSVLALFFLIAFILFRNNRIKQKANDLLKDQKNQIENSLTEVRSTQAQLVQREKMASLGELTAGVAHEIQNPLNFVNNFSEVNMELMEEMRQDLIDGNINEALRIASDIMANEGKINHHGKRADDIVKGMLLHSRGNSGNKVPTDINALVDEHLRLAYHGFRAKDKAFNVNMVTRFDGALDKVDIIPQDVGRVILNIISNAFYAVAKREEENQDGYVPTVEVSTSRTVSVLHAGLSELLIKIKDNGIGVPQGLVDKIFQPFFTTKPAGQGTGLGLSMSYDIVKAHGGELKVETEEGKGSEFIVRLPVV